MEIETKSPPSHREEKRYRAQLKSMKERLHKPRTLSSSWRSWKWFLLFCLSSWLLTPNSLYAQLNTERLTAIGRNALYFDDYVLSIQYFNQVIRQKPYLAEPYLYRAIAKIQLEDYTGALSDLNIAIQNNPFIPGSYYTRGFVYRQLQQLSKAEEDFQQALTFSPENRTYMLLLADVKSQQKKYTEALQDLDYLLKREPKSASLHFEKGTILLAQKDTLQALQSFTQATEYDSQNPANWSAKGLTNLLLQHKQEAIADLTEAITLGSRWAGDYINRGILYYQNHNYRAALADYDKAVEINPKDAQCYFNRGLLRAEVGDYNRALEDFNEAISLVPENTEMFYQRGVVNLQLRQWQDALADFEALILRYPYFLPSYYLAAQALTALDKPKEAYQYQQKAHQLEKDKEAIAKAAKTQEPATSNLIAANQPQKKDRRKEFSNRAAQNQNTHTEEQEYQSEARGNVQKRHVDVMNEPNITLSYYAQNQALRSTNYFHYIVDQLNKQNLLPSPLHFTTQEVALTADMVAQHFEQINLLTNALKEDKAPQTEILLLQRAIEFALVSDYSSAVEDLTTILISKLPNLQTSPLLYFLRSNYRYKLLEYQIYTDESTTSDQLKLQTELILRDLDQVILQQPDFAFAYYNKANILCSQKDYKAAIQYYTKAIEVDKNFAEAYFNRGLTHIYIDQVEQGISDLSKSGELGIYQAYNLITRFK